MDTPIMYNEYPKPNLISFVDDCYVKAIKPENETFQETVMTTMTVIENYIQSNRLSLNPDKIQVILITKN